MKILLSLFTFFLIFLFVCVCLRIFCSCTFINSCCIFFGFLFNRGGGGCCYWCASRSSGTTLTLIGRRKFLLRLHHLFSTNSGQKTLFLYFSSTIDCSFLLLLRLFFWLHLRLSLWLLLLLGSKLCCCRFLLLFLHFTYHFLELLLSISFCQRVKETTLVLLSLYEFAFSLIGVRLIVLLVLLHLLLHFEALSLFE